ncbi:MAG: tetratricopeptide repeat protein [Bacteroidota bacterium]|nr:tetratricopeptide repeat protein [Bacteroidota bacterium]
MKKTPFFYALTAGILALLLWSYSNHFNNPFQFDDSHTIVTNTAIRSIKNVPGFFRDAQTTSSLPPNQAYRPGLTTLNAIDRWIGGSSEPIPLYFHISIFICFVILGVLLYFLFLKIFNKSFPNELNSYFALFGAGWFCLHTANAETINYIISRSDSFSTLMIVISMLIFIGKPAWRSKFIYLIPLIIGLFVKEPAAVTGFLILFYVLLFEYRVSITDAFLKANRSKLFKAILIAVPALAAGIVYMIFAKKMTPDTWTSGGGEWYYYLATQPFVIVHYINNFFLPFNLSADTDWVLITNFFDDRVIIGTLIIISLLTIAIRLSKYEAARPITFGLLWFFIALAPTSSVIPLAEVLNDHRPFFPYIGLVMAVVWTIALLIYKYNWQPAKSFAGKMIFTTALIFLIAHAYGTHQRNKVWSSGESLWQDVTIKSPKNPRGLMNYGLALMSRGQFAEAEASYKKALALWPYYPYVHINLGVVREAVGDYPGAESYFKDGIRYGAQYPDGYYFYGRFLINQLRYSEARPLLEKGFALSPGHTGIRILLMKIYNEASEWDKLKSLAENTLLTDPGNAEAMTYLKATETKKNAIILTEEEIKKAPTPQKYLDLSLMYYQAADYKRSILAAENAIRLKPDYAEAFNNIGSSYNMLKEYDKAIAACKKALEINPSFELAKNNLALALNNFDQLQKQEQLAASQPSAENYLNLSLTYYNQGKFEKCIDACNKALKLKPGYVDAYNNIGAAYIQLKQWDKAIEACNSALKVEPEHKLARGNLNWAIQEKEKAGQ